MPQTLVGTQKGTAPTRRQSPPIVEVRQLWGDIWQIAPDIEVVSASLATGAGVGQCELRRNYAPDLTPSFTGTSEERRPLERLDWWVRISFADEKGIPEVSWVGQIVSEQRTVGSAKSKAVAGPGVVGVQRWVGASPMRRLEKLAVSTSVWLVPTASGPSPPTVEKLIGWVPAMNSGSRNEIVGNRSDSITGGTYVYGGDSLWSRLDYLNYILLRYVDESGSGGPAWTLSGQTAVLAQMTDTMNFGFAPSVADILRRLINPENGLGFKIMLIPVSPSPGFEIEVFTLQARTVRVFGTAIPGNVRLVDIEPAEFGSAIEVDVVETVDQQYDRIEVIGGRMVVMMTLRMDNGLLEAQWTDELETAYKAGTGTPSDDEKDHDRARAADHFRAVYQQFGAAQGFGPIVGVAGPSLDEVGNVIGVGMDHQDRERSTLAWTPLREGVEYDQVPAVDHNPAGRVPELLSPMAWVTDFDTAGYVAVDTIGMSVSAARNDWGLMIGASPNHLLALNNFDGAAKSKTEPRNDYNSLVVTLALLADQPLKLVFDGGSASGGKKNTKVIRVPDAELWYVPANTVVRVDETGTLILRNDAPRLETIMAGAIARYHLTRPRAKITLQGYHAWAGLLGQMLRVVEQGAATQIIQAPITEVRWSAGGDDGKGSRTQIRTGFAR